MTPFRILCLVLLGSLGFAIAAEKPASTVTEGTLGPCKIKIAVPAKWNGQVLMIAHGRVAESSPLSADFSVDSPLNAALLKDGWLIAASSYRRNGYIIDEAVEDMEQLRQHVIAKYGQPKRVFLEGGSMGGDIVVLLAERYPDHYAGVLSAGAALVFAPKKYSFAPTIPILFLCTPDEIDDKREYVAKAKDAPVRPVLWFVKRMGHCRFNDQEKLASFRGLLAFADTGKCETEKDTTVETAPPPSTAIFENGVARVKIKKVYSPSGSLKLAFTKADFETLKINLGTRFQVTYGEKTVTVLYGNNYSDVPTGEWIAFAEAEGDVRLARNWANANEILSSKEGETLILAPLAEAH